MPNNPASPSPEQRPSALSPAKLVDNWTIRNCSEPFDEDAALEHMRKTDAAFSQSVARIYDSIINQK